MPEAAVANDLQSRSLPAYRSSWEHLRDELRLLLTLIQLRLRDQRQDRSASALDQFKGLVITETEIADLLAELSRTSEPAMNADRADLIETSATLASEIEQRRVASSSEGISLSLPTLARLFGLNRFEEQCLVMCIAAEVDRRYEKLFAYLHDDVTRKKATVDLVLNVLCSDGVDRIDSRIAFESRSPLIKHQMLRLSDASEPLPSRSIKLEDRIVNFILGVSGIDSRLGNSSRNESLTTCSHAGNS